MLGCRTPRPDKQSTHVRTPGKEAGTRFYTGEDRMVPGEKGHTEPSRIDRVVVRYLPTVAMSAKFSSITAWYRLL